VVELDIADSHPFSHPLRVDKVVERLEVHAPEISGWLRKEVKLKPQRLDKEYITSLTVSGNETHISLRSSVEGVGAGYDVVVRRVAPRVSLTRVGEGAELPAFDLTDEDETRMLDLEEKLVAHAGGLIDARRALAWATLGGQPLDGHPSARTMVERLVQKIAPVVQEIARHSLTQTELVLKRLLDNGRREEIFLPRRELEQKFEGLADGGRTILATLGLSEPAAVVAPTPAPVAVAPQAAPVAVAPEAAPVAPQAAPPAEPAPPLAENHPSDEAVVAQVAVSRPPPTSVGSVRTATESQRPGPVAPRPGSLAPPRPSSRPAPGAPPTGGEGADEGKP
jgi:hypothetical protein